MSGKHKKLKYDLSGRRFERLEVLSFAGRRERGRAWWLCRCDCGTEKEVSQKQLLSGRTRSCGCLQRDAATAASTSHGLSETPEYQVWCGMKRRCLNPNDQDYHNYGGRGVVISEDWMDFSNFIRDMGPRPSPLHSIERKEVDGNYEMGNCYWATSKEQSRNQRKTIIITHGGKTMCLKDWSVELGMKYSCLYRRVVVDKMPVSEAFTTPARVWSKKKALALSAPALF